LSHLGKLAIINWYLKRSSRETSWADATLLPEALGKPPILTIMALAKRIARTIRGT
jgi:hypothetical protein